MELVSPQWQRLCPAGPGLSATQNEKGGGRKGGRKEAERKEEERVDIILDHGSVASNVSLLEMQILRLQMKSFMVEKKTFINHLADKGFIIIICEEVLELNRN